jgi:hypothetical protein
MAHEQGPTTLENSLKAELRTAEARMVRADREEAVYPLDDWDLTLIKYQDGKPLFNTGFQPRILDVNGKKVQAHQTNNLYIKLLTAKAIESEIKLNPTAPLVRWEQKFYREEGGLEVFKKFQEKYPDLYEKVLEISNRVVFDEDYGIELLTERDILCSVAFEKIADIAIDEGLEPYQLVK